ncbi:hypothetical protein DesyoDRAFT_5318 [Desulfosporosinus youngiae DSM 17734]|uniref:Uncharacterized protein n=2 Tax=Desulfosporosinus TaxID=79206 RepID=H5Y0J0_9FIRM|nr:hypothetical protein DesyoDRAFT_5318 [Desulfosporosinus youngiae DSM 17734]
MFWMGFVIVLAILSWTVGPSYEWVIPLKWQTSIEGWKERFSKRSCSLNFVWKLSQENGELEKRVWLLRKELPGLQKMNRLPLNVEVQICSDLSLSRLERYIACLQRRFTEITICVCPCKSKGDNGGTC